MFQTSNLSQIAQLKTKGDIYSHRMHSFNTQKSTLQNTMYEMEQRRKQSKNSKKSMKLIDSRQLLEGVHPPNLDRVIEKLPKMLGKKLRILC